MPAEKNATKKSERSPMNNQVAFRGYDVMAGVATLNMTNIVRSHVNVTIILRDRKVIFFGRKST